MPLWNLTMEKVKKLMKLRDEKEQLLKILMETPIKTLWTRDLDTLQQAYDSFEKEEEESTEERSKLYQQGKSQARSTKSGATRRKVVPKTTRGKKSSKRRK